MIKSIGLVLLTFSGFICRIECQPSEKKTFFLCKDIQKHFEIFDSLRKANPDIMQEEEIKFEKLLANYKQYIFNSPEISNCEWLYIAKSSDKKFCLISWDTEMGGTMIDFATMALFKKASGDIETKMLIDKSEGNGTENTLMHYDTIYTVSNSQGIYYLAQGFGQGSTALPWQEIRAFVIKNDRLNYPPLFPNHQSNVHVEFDLHEFDNLRRIPSIKVKENGNRIFVPEANEKGGFTGKYKVLFLKARIIQHSKRSVFNHFFQQERLAQLKKKKRFQFSKPLLFALFF